MTDDARNRLCLTSWLVAEGWHVCFSDFNREVLDKVTIPNVRLNVEERNWPLADYYSGDWASLSPLLDEVR